LVFDLVPDRLSWKFHGGYHKDVVALCFLFWASYHGGMIGHNAGRVLKSCSYFLLLYFLFYSCSTGRSQVIALRRSYCDDFSHSCFYYFCYYNNIILVYCFPLLLLLFRARSQVIYLRGRYNDSCWRKHIRWYLNDTWIRVYTHRVVYMNCTHSCNEGEEYKVRTF
jgi:hypothetical protein